MLRAGAGRMALAMRDIELARADLSVSRLLVCTALQQTSTAGAERRYCRARWPVDRGTGALPGTPSVAGEVWGWYGMKQ